jgi:hypothetical protein
MEDSKLVEILNALAARCVYLECQMIALQRLLIFHSKSFTEEELDALVLKSMDAYKEFVSPKKSASERLEQFLRGCEGPPQ